MSASRYIDVWCDVCGTWDETATSYKAVEARAKERLRRGLGAT